MAPPLLPSKTEWGKDMALYSPHRVMRQLGYYQGAVTISGSLGPLRHPWQSLGSSAKERTRFWQVLISCSGLWEGLVQGSQVVQCTSSGVSIVGTIFLNNRDNPTL